MKIKILESAKEDLKEGFQKGFPSLSITVSREMR